jgi:uncharacterized repeat protein (TIGR01451 family)
MTEVMRDDEMSRLLSACSVRAPAPYSCMVSMGSAHPRKESAIVTSTYRRVLNAVAAFILLTASVTVAAQSEVDIEKFTNGQDADTAPGPAVLVGSTVNWTYVVTNTGSRPLTNIVVTDDQGVTVTCPASTLDVGLSFTCTASDVASLNQYANVGTVTAELPDATPVQDSDPSHYFGQAAPAVTIEKHTNGVDADTPPGPSVPAGSTVNWTYEVTNIGSDPLADVVVTDDQGVAVTCPATTLAAAESMTCTASGVAQPGQYANIGTVEATLPSEDGVVASDPSHYYGQTLLLIKRTNGIEAHTPPGPTVAPGSAVTWTYEVTNPGPATVTGVAVTDDQGVTVTCPQTTLAAAESMTCTASGVAINGQYTNVGTVTATLPLGGTVSADDASHYFSNPIDIEKFTNGDDADTSPGVGITPGDPVTWTYEVTNLGSDPLTEVVVTDDQGVAVTCPQTTLAAGESMTCTANGIAIAGQYANVGTVEGTLPSEAIVSAADPSHYFGQDTSLDFGDAPDPTYQSLFASNGARHILGGTFFLGACVDAEADALSSAAADGDDLAAGTPFGTCVTAGDDEDGVTFTTDIRVGLTASVDVVASEPCTLSAWIDFNGDGDWGEPDDDLFPGGTVLVAGSNSLDFTVPAGAVPGSTFARFRCTSAGAVSFTGEASDGEVEDYAVTIITPTPDVSATKDDALLVDVDVDTLADPGDTLRYTIVITNNGTGDATSVVFSDTPDANTSIVAGSVTTTVGSVTSDDPTVVVDVGTLAAYGGSVTITFDVVVDDPLAAGVTEVSNQGSVSGTNISTVATNIVVTPINRTPDVTATKADALLVDADNDGLAEPGDTLRYTIVITNDGDADALGVVLDDTPDANTAIVIGSVTTTQGSVTSDDPSVVVNIGTLAAYGGTVTITFDVVIDDPLAAGVTEVSNQGSISGTNFSTVATNTVVTQLTLAPIVTATKTVAMLGSAYVLRYTIILTNSGNADALGVQFDDTPDPNTSIVNGSVTTTQGSVTSDDPSVIVNIGTLAAYGGIATITFDVVFNGPELTSVSNQGTVTGSNVAPVQTDDPSLPGAADPTVFAPATFDAVPSLDPRALLALLVILGAIALTRVGV